MLIFLYIRVIWSKLAKTEILYFKSDYLSRIDSKTDENDIYGTLKPLVEGVSANMESFFEASLHRFEHLHEFVQEFSRNLHNMAEENVETADHYENASLKLIGSIRTIADSMGEKDGAKSLTDFKIRYKSCIINVFKL